MPGGPATGLPLAPPQRTCHPAWETRSCWGKLGAGATGRCRRCCRDIKLENTLLDGAQPLPNVKICDFGYSKNEFVDSRPKTVSGTPDYIAPEVGGTPGLPILVVLLGPQTGY